jgi:hypothetical protein
MITKESRGTCEIECRIIMAKAAFDKKKKKKKKKKRRRRRKKKNLSPTN